MNETMYETGQKYDKFCPFHQVIQLDYLHCVLWGFWTIFFYCTITLDIKYLFLSKLQHGTQLCLSISVLTVIFVKECMKINVSRVKFATACQCLLFVQRKFSAGYFARLPFAKNRFCAPIKFWGALFPSYVARFPC